MSELSRWGVGCDCLGGGIIGGGAKEKKYIITNLIGPIGNFERGTYQHATGITYSTRHKYGEYSIALQGSADAGETTYTLVNADGTVVKPHLYPTHKYYVSCWLLQTAVNGSMDFYWPIAEPVAMSGMTVPAASEQDFSRVSKIFTRESFTEGDYEVRIDYNNNNSTTYMWYDGLMLVDLTATFGAGNEPSKDWCDYYLDFTETSYELENPDLTAEQWQKYAIAYYSQSNGNIIFYGVGTDRRFYSGIDLSKIYDTCSFDNSTGVYTLSGEHEFGYSLADSYLGVVKANSSDIIPVYFKRTDGNGVYGFGFHGILTNEDRSFNIYGESGQQYIVILKNNASLDNLWYYQPKPVPYKGTYIETIFAPKDTYPENGEQDGYWWVKVIN